jgi:hypothetical protein
MEYSSDPNATSVALEASFEMLAADRTPSSASSAEEDSPRDTAVLGSAVVSESGIHSM